MAMEYPETWDRLEHPSRRFELLAYIEELATPDPRPIWDEERRRGLISDIDQVFHFFFDDNDFGNDDIGYALFDEHEVQTIGAITRAVDSILSERPKGDDDDFVEHPRWRDVTDAATEALGQMKMR